MTNEIKIRMNEESTGYLLYHLTTLLQRTMKRELDKIELTHTQFIILATLFRLSQINKNVTQVDIANESKTDKMMVSKILRTLQNKNLLTRQEHSTDTRAKIIMLTEEGKTLFKQAFSIVKGVEKKFFEPLAQKKDDFNVSINLLLNSNQD